MFHLSLLSSLPLLILPCSYLTTFICFYSFSSWSYCDDVKFFCLRCPSGQCSLALGLVYLFFWRFQCSVRAGVETFGRQGGWLALSLFCFFRKFRRTECRLDECWGFGIVGLDWTGPFFFFEYFIMPNGFFFISFYSIFR